MTDKPVERRFARTVNNYDEREADGQQMIFKAFAFLLAKPVHEKAVRRVNGQNGDNYGKGVALVASPPAVIFIV
jgi:hypothetical protein